MNLNRETPHTKSEKAATMALIEISQFENSPNVVCSVPELESWDTRKRRITSNQSGVNSIHHKTTRPMSSYRVSQLDYFNKQLVQPLVQPQRKDSFCASTRENSKSRRMSIPQISLLIPEKHTIRMVLKPSSLLKARTRSNSMKDVNQEKKKEQTKQRPREKAIDIPHITKTINMIIRSEILKNRINKENNAATKPISSKIQHFSQVSLTANLPTIINISL